MYPYIAKTEAIQNAGSLLFYIYHSVQFLRLKKKNAPQKAQTISVH